MIGSIIGAVGGIASGIASGIAGRKAAKKNRRILNNMRRDSQNWYDKEYNADFTQRSDAQAALNKARAMLDDKYKQAQGAGIVAGATDESIALQKKAANATLADITGSIAERADAYKEQVRNNYVNEQNAINNSEIAVNNQQAANVAQAASGLSQAAGSLGKLF